MRRRPRKTVDDVNGYPSRSGVTLRINLNEKARRLRNAGLSETEHAKAESAAPNLSAIRTVATPVADRGDSAAHVTRSECFEEKLHQHHELTTSTEESEKVGLPVRPRMLQTGSVRFLYCV